MKRKTERGVFCIEAFDDSESSFGPSLKLLSQQLDFSILNANVRTVKTRPALTKAIREWGDNPQWKYPILWMSGHGNKEGFYVNDPKGAANSRLDFGTLIDMASETYSWSGCLVHFAACSTLSGHDDHHDILKGSGLAGISGYSKDVDWIPSLSFEMLYMQFLQQAMKASDSERGFTESVLAECRQRLFDSRMCSGLIDYLGFRMITRADVRLE